MDTIELKKLKINCIVGVSEYERENSQDIYADISIKKDLSEAAFRSDINNTIDPIKLSNLLESYAVQSQSLMLETLAYELAFAVHTKYKIEHVKIKLKKQSALDNLKHVVVKVKLTRKEFKKYMAKYAPKAIS